MNVKKIKTEKKVLLAMPVAKGDISQETFNSVLGLDFCGSIRTLGGSLVDDAREKLAEDAIKEGYTHILWTDSDMVFEHDALNKLLEDDKDIVTGICFKRVPPYTPAIYKCGQVYIDYPKDSLFEVDECGFGFILTKVSALKEVLDEFGGMFQRAYPYGEDISFCKRWRELTKKTGMPHTIWCDSRVKIGHVGTTIVTEKTFELSTAKLMEMRKCQKETK